MKQEVAEEAVKFGRAAKHNLAFLCSLCYLLFKIEMTLFLETVAELLTNELPQGSKVLQPFSLNSNSPRN